MAAQVEVQTGEVGRPVVGGRLHLSPLVDSTSSSSSLMELPSISKPAPGPRPRLSPKPFAMDRNPTIKPIVAPKPLARPRPQSTRLAVHKLELPRTPRTQPDSAPGPSPAARNTASRFSAGQTSKPVAQPFKPAPPLLPPEPSSPVERPRPASLKYSHSLKKLPGTEGSGTATAQPEEQATPGKGGASITRAKSMGFLTEAVRDEEERQKAKQEVAAVLRPRPARPRPVSALFLESTAPACAAEETPPPHGFRRRPLSADLTSRFESIGLSLHRSAPHGGAREAEDSRGRDAPLAPPPAAVAPQSPTYTAAVPEQSAKKAEEATTRRRDERRSTIKSRISLLLDSSSPTTSGAPPTASDLPSPQPEGEPAVCVRQLIRQLTEETPHSHSPALKPALKSRPLHLDRSKRFSTGWSPDLSGEKSERHDIVSNDPQRGVEESVYNPGEQPTSPTARDSQEKPASLLSPPAGAAQTVRASLFENVVERCSVQVLDDGTQQASSPLSSASLSRGGRDERGAKKEKEDDEEEEEGMLVTVTYKEPSPPSSPLRAAHAFDRVLAVEESRAVSQQVAVQAQREDKATTLRSSRRSQAGGPSTGGSTGAQPRYLRVGALQKWNNMGQDEEGSSREAEQQQQQKVIEAPKQLKTLQAEEAVKPRATFFALTGQIQESSPSVRRNTSLGDALLNISRGVEEPLVRRSDSSEAEVTEGEKKREEKKAKMKELARERQRQLEAEKEALQEFERKKAQEAQRQRALRKEKQEQEERQRALARQRQVELEKQQQELEKQRQLERQRAIEAEKLWEQEMEKQRKKEEKERQLLEIQKEKQRMEELEKMREMERRRDLERKKEMERIKEMERMRDLEKKREVERIREMERKREQQRKEEQERQQLMEQEKQRLREKKEREEAEKIKQMALEQEMLRMREMERELEKERQRQLDMERQELEKQKLRQRELEKERQRKEEMRERERKEFERMRELERMREMQRLQEMERQRLQEMERQRLQEMERQRLQEMERQRLQEMEKQLEMEKQRQLEMEKQRLLEMERRRQLEMEKQKQLEMEKQRLQEMEKQRLQEMEKQRLQEMEKQRLQEMEKQRLQEMEKQKQLEMEKQRLQEMEKQRLQEMEKQRLQEMEKQKLRQRDLEKERQRKEEMERMMEKLRQQEMEKQRKELERAKEQERMKEKQRLKELEHAKEQERRQLEEFERRQQKEEAERLRQTARRRDSERQQPKELEKTRLDSSALRPSVVDLDSVLRVEPVHHKVALQRSDPATRWREPSDSHRTSVLDADLFSAPIQNSPSKDPGLVSVWAPTPQDPWELRPVEMSVDQPGPEQLLAPQRSWTSVLAEQLPAGPLLAGGGNSSIAAEPAWLQDMQQQHHQLQQQQQLYQQQQQQLYQQHQQQLYQQQQRRSHGSAEPNRMRSRSMSRRSAPPGGVAETALSRMRSRSAHREHESHGWVHKSPGGEDDVGGGAESPPALETDSQYGTWETGLRTDDSLSPLTPSSDSNPSPSPKKATPTHTPADAVDGVLPASFPEAPPILLDTSALRSRAQLAKKRAPRSRPSRATRLSSAVPAEGATEDWMYRDTTESKVKREDSDSDTEEPTKGTDSSPPGHCQPQRVALFPGMDPLALKAQLKKRSDTDGQADSVSPSQLSRSPKSPFLPRAARVLPPPGGKESSEESPQWLKELKSKKRLSQYDGES